MQGGGGICMGLLVQNFLDQAGEVIFIIIIIITLMITIIFFVLVDIFADVAAHCPSRMRHAPLMRLLAGRQQSHVLNTCKAVAVEVS